MTIIWTIFYILIAVSYGSDPGARTSRDSSRSREVESYLRSMAKTRPNWSDEKILRSARSIYGDALVPRSMPHYEPGKAPVRTAGATHHMVEGMSIEEKKAEIFRIRRENPSWGATDVVTQFRNEFPLEPNPPDWNSVQGYLFFQRVDERIAGLPETRIWTHLPPEIKSMVSQAGKGIMKRRYLENPQENWEELVFGTVAELNRLHGVRLSASSVYKWYLDARKEVMGHGSRRGPKRARRD